MLIRRLYSKSVFYVLSLVCFISLTTLIFIDTSLVKNNIIAFLPYQKGFLDPFFVILSVGVISTVIAILIISRKLISENQKLFDKELLVSSNASILVYVFICLLLIILDYTILSQNKYPFFLPVIIIYLSYFFGLAFCGLTIAKFLKWFQQGREFRILGYLIAISTLFALIVFSISFFSVNPHDLSLEIKSTDIENSIVSRSIVSNIFQTWFTISSILCIVSISIISFFVLRDYVKMNFVLYLVMFSIPVLYIIFKYIPLAMSMVISLIMKDPLFYGTLYTLFFSGTGALTGFLFFLPMWFFASKLKNYEIKKYLWFTSFGMLLFFTANQQPPLQIILFPPFGVLSSSITGLSLYLIFLGISSTSKYLSNVTAYRELISKKLREDKIFRSIARSSFEKQLRPIVNTVLEKNLFPVEDRYDISPGELNLYVTEVKKLLQDKKKGHNEERKNNST